MSFSDDVPQVDHAALSFARLIWQYRGDQPRLQAFLQAFIDEVQSAEDVTWQVYTERWPSTAVGAQLDVLGRIVGAERGTLTDDEYRLVILAKILINRSNGTLPELNEWLEVLGITQQDVVEYPDAEVLVEITDLDHPDIVRDLLGGWKSAGVLLRSILSASTDASVFRWGELGGTPTADAGRGWGDLGGSPVTGGGVWAEGDAR